MVDITKIKAKLPTMQIGFLILNLKKTKEGVEQVQQGVFKTQNPSNFKRRLVQFDQITLEFQQIVLEFLLISLEFEPQLYHNRL